MKYIILNNIDLTCEIFLDIKTDENIYLSDFLFENLNIKNDIASMDKSLIKKLSLKNVNVNGSLTE
jgi:hypothetical protein